MPPEHDDFEDAAEYGINPDLARRGNKLYLAIRNAINDSFPNAFSGDPEDHEVVTNCLAAALGEMMAITRFSVPPHITEALLQKKIEFTRAKIEQVANAFPQHLPGNA